MAVPPDPQPLIIAAAPPLAGHMLAALHAANIPAVAVTSAPAARALLLCGRPGALVAAVHLGAHNGLQVVHMARQLHHSLPKIVIGEADPVLEAEAERVGAQYVTEPIDPAEIVAIARRLLGEGDAPRRWRRLRIGPHLDALVNGWPSHVVDVGYGGVGLDLPKLDGSLPQSFDVQLPAEGMTVAAQRMWQQTAGAGVRCGALVTEVPTVRAAQWRAFVDRYRLEEWRRAPHSGSDPDRV